MAQIVAASETCGSVCCAVYTSRGEAATLQLSLPLPQVYSRLYILDVFRMLLSPPTKYKMPLDFDTRFTVLMFLECNCNGFSDRCIFDKDLYAATGHGGRCLECRGNHDGPNCERCRLNYFQPAGQSGLPVCYTCNCNEIGL